MDINSFKKAAGKAAGTSTSASEEAKAKLDEMWDGTEGEDTGMGTKSIDWGKYMDGGDDFRKSYRYNQARRRNTGPAIHTKIGDVYRNKKDFTFLGNYIQDSLGESLERMSKHGTLPKGKKTK
jgi:hypothetical protein